MPEDNRQQSVFFCAQNTRKTSYVEMKHKKERGIYMTFKELLEEYQKEYGMMVCEPPAYMYEKKQGEFTVDDFEHLPESSRIELIDGEFVVMDATTTVHQKVAAYLTTIFGWFILQRKGKCRVYTAPGVRPDPEDRKTELIPDVVVQCDQEKDNGKYLSEGPDLVVEVLSPGTRHRDLGIKKIKYQEGGVCEYWTVDLKKKCVIVHRFEEDEVMVYTLDDVIPVGIFAEECVVDLKEMCEYAGI